jgi:ribonuclease P protein component
MTSRRTFPKCNRLSRQRDFQRVLSVRRRAGNRLLVVYVAPNQLSFSRMGLRAGREVGGAVTRNRLKRLVREAFRLTRDQIPAGLDIVCIVRPADTPTLQLYLAHLPRLIRAAAQKLEA